MKLKITFSAFDLLYTGHIKMFEKAKKERDSLICGLQINSTLDKPKKINQYNPL